MKYEVINNFDDSNHKSIIELHLKNCDEFIIISPFLSNNFNSFSFTKFSKHLKKIILVTTFKQNITEQINKIYFFEELFAFGHRTGIKIEIFIDNSLHAKIYLFKNGANYLKGIITSANFTQSGLLKNNEWGVLVEDSNTLIDIENKIFSNIVFERITYLHINTFKKKIANIMPPKPEKENHIDLLSDLIIKTNPLNLSTNTTYWLKPIGTKEAPIPWAKSFDKFEENLHFSDKNPTGVNIGDILIAYAVLHKNILSIYKVQSNVLKDTSNIRFPYYVLGENITPFYGGNWFNYNITISNQRDEVLSKNLFNITPSGKNSYGSFMYGADKLKITKDFAEYLIKIVIKIDKQIEASIIN